MHKSRMEERLSFALNLILCDIATNFWFLGKKHDKNDQLSGFVLFLKTTLTLKNLF